jgi:hypothetical protein
MVMDEDPARLDSRHRTGRSEKAPKPHPPEENAAFRLLEGSYMATDLNAPLDASHRGIEGPKFQIM